VAYHQTLTNRLRCRLSRNPVSLSGPPLPSHRSHVEQADHRRQGRVLSPDPGTDIRTPIEERSDAASARRVDGKQRDIGDLGCRNGNVLLYRPEGRPAACRRAGIARIGGKIFRLLPEKDQTNRTWNARSWAKERKGWIFITSRPPERETLRPLHSLWIDLLVMRLLTAPQPGQKPVWFVIDELTSLQKLPQLHTAITENRKSKNPLVLGFQGKAQLGAALLDFINLSGIGGIRVS
jgi:hypothetical protein